MVDIKFGEYTVRKGKEILSRVYYTRDAFPKTGNPYEDFIKGNTYTVTARTRRSGSWSGEKLPREVSIKGDSAKIPPNSVYWEQVNAAYKKIKAKEAERQERLNANWRRRKRRY
jgi:hypothetical protein